jgi:hypothetical protein
MDVDDDGGETPRKPRASRKRGAVQSPHSDDEQPARKRSFIIDPVRTVKSCLRSTLRFRTECLRSVQGKGSGVQAAGGQASGLDLDVHLLHELEAVVQTSAQVGGTQGTASEEEEEDFLPYVFPIHFRFMN